MSEQPDYTETKREKFGMSEITRRYNNGDVETRLEEFDWGKRKYVVRNRTVIHPDGASEKYNFEGLKSEETLADGTVRQFYADGSIKSESLPNGTERWFYDDGKVCGEVTKDGIERLYYNNGALSKQENPAAKHIIGYAKEGGIDFEIKDKDVFINPAYFSYYVIGIKTDITTEHWAENISFNPHKKMLLCLGGDATTVAQAANGNINAALDALGFSGEECENIQLAACYRPGETSSLGLALRKNEINRAKIAAEDYRREIGRVFMPFMAKKSGEKFVMLSEKELFARFRNIMLLTHCAGADDVPIIENTLKKIMTELGYGKMVQKYALRQILCITNNNQREFTKDNSDMTVMHRYSVWDGQRNHRYNYAESDDYGVFLEKYQPFHNFKGKTSGIVNLRKNEALLICDKVLKQGDEHNYGFFTADNASLTAVGQWQARLMQSIGQFWLKNKKALPSVKEMILSCVRDDAKLLQKVEKAFVSGRRTQRAKISPLTNPAIIDAAYYRWRNMSVLPGKKVIYKLLSERIK